MTGGVKEAENLYSSPFDTSVEKAIYEQLEKPF